MADISSVSSRKTAIIALLTAEAGPLSWTTLLYRSKNTYSIRRRYGLHRLAIDGAIADGDIELAIVAGLPVYQLTV